MGIFESLEPDCTEVANEWELCSPEKFKTGDVLLHALLTDPKYKIPQNRPDGNYWPENASTTTVVSGTTTTGTTTGPDVCDEIDVFWAQGAKWGTVVYQTPDGVFIRYKIQNVNVNSHSDFTSNVQSNS